MTIAVGDFDSASAEAVREAEASGTRIERHPTEKDATDLELALDAAVNSARSEFWCSRSSGPARPPLLALLLLGASRYAGIELDADIGHARVNIVRGERALSGQPGELLSLFALHGPAEGVRTRGLAYPLDAERPRAGIDPRRIERLRRGDGHDHVEHGLVLAIRPGLESQGARREQLCKRPLRFRFVDPCLSGGLRRRGKAERRRSRHARLVRRLGRREGGVRGDERPRAPNPPVRRRGRAALEGAAHRREPAGRRPLRRRQQPAFARARRRPLRAVRVAAPRSGWTSATYSTPSTA